MRNVNFKILPLVLVSVALALVGAGCGDDAENTASTTANGSDAAMKAKEETAAMKQKAGAAMKEKTAGAASGGAMIAANHEIQSGSVDEYGEILQDGKGHSIYVFTADKSGESDCYDDCAKAWPPVLTKGAPKAGNGADQSKLGTIKRTDGTTQVTYDDQPLYFYVNETKPNQVLCQAVAEFGGKWYIVAPGGKPITKS